MKHLEIKKAAKDFQYLLDRGYPRKASLELIGNRYQLDSSQRHLLHRGIFSKKDSKSRLKKKILLKALKGNSLAVDGYNVLITIEAGISKRPLILGNDGFVRDISGLSKNYKKSKTTIKALKLIFKILNKVKPSYTLFLFDSPISRSGELASDVRGFLKKEGLSGDAIAIKVPEDILIGFPGIVATSDTAIIDRSRKVVDLAGDILKIERFSKSIIKLK